MKGLSLFANIGISEALLKDIGLSVVIANEICSNRSKIYKYIYPNTEMIEGDITSNKVFSEITKKSREKKIDFIIATPPCQGMSTAGKQNPRDERNNLIFFAIQAIKDIKPKYVLIENVPQQLRTKINVNGSDITIPDYLKQSLSDNYQIEDEIINCADYGVPQMRKRSLFLLSRKGLKRKLSFLNKKEHTNHISLADAIGDLPSLDPLIQGNSIEEQLEYFPNFQNKRTKGLSISKWHKPPKHKLRHVEIMKHTPEGKSALFNKFFYPKKPDNTRIKGYKNTYRRQLWNRPAYTITSYNGAICSQDNVHPGRPDKINGKVQYSDARVFSLYELMILMSIPKDWNMPDWANDSHLRHAIGEGLPPLVINKLFKKLIKSNE